MAPNKPAAPNSAKPAGSATAPAKDKDPTAAQRAYAAGTRAYEAKNLPEAVQQLSAALANGGLGNQQMAKALYYRGSAYRQQGKPAQAISDLTTAVWIKGGLAGPDKVKAVEERQSAYVEAGLGDNVPPVGLTVASQGAKAPDVSSATSQPQVTPGAQVAAAPAQSSIWNFLPKLPSLPNLLQGSPASAPTPGAQAVPETAPVATTSTATSSWDTSTAAAASAPLSSGFAPTGGEVAAAPQQAASAEPAAAATNPVSGFFNSLLNPGGGTAEQATAQPSTPLSTGSTGPSTGSAEGSAQVPQQTSSIIQRGPEDDNAPLPWAVQTVAVATQPDSNIDGAASTPKPSRRAIAVAGRGKYRLQVAAVRSREEADQVAQSLLSNPQLQGGSLKPEVDEAAFGSSGKFYRVRLGPYADAIEPNELCKNLRPQGYDCLVVTQ
ncbi:MAG: SPOR domain-containing protein [Hyphomicrobium sp.]